MPDLLEVGHLRFGCRRHIFVLQEPLTACHPWSVHVCRRTASAALASKQAAEPCLQMYHLARADVASQVRLVHKVTGATRPGLLQRRPREPGLAALQQCPSAAYQTLGCQHRCEHAALTMWTRRKELRKELSVRVCI